MHADCGRGEWVVWWEHERAPVLAAFVGGVGRAGEDVVPFEDVGFTGVRDDVGRWRSLDILVFALEALRSCAVGHGGQ